MFARGAGPIEVPARVPIAVGGKDLLRASDKHEKNVPIYDNYNIVALWLDTHLIDVGVCSFCMHWSSNLVVAAGSCTVVVVRMACMVFAMDSLDVVMCTGVDIRCSLLDVGMADGYSPAAGSKVVWLVGYDQSAVAGARWT